MTEFCEIQQLVKLFNPDRNGDDSDSDQDNDREERIPKQYTSAGQPGETKVNPYAKITPENKKEEADVCEENYIVSQDEQSLDWKKTPKWNISYRQQVSASDVFLQMSAKTPGTASCEDMIVTIDLPGEHMQNIDIKVHPTELEVHSPSFAIKIPLPQPVHPQKGDAKWDKDQEKLSITLRMEREFDFINF